MQAVNSARVSSAIRPSPGSGTASRAPDGVGDDARGVDGEDDMRLGAEVLDDLRANAETGQRGIRHGAVPEIRRPDPEDHAPLREPRCLGERKRGSSPKRSLPSTSSASDQVHRGRADKRGHEEVGGLAEQPLRRVYLLQDTVPEHRHAVTDVIASTWSCVT